MIHESNARSVVKSLSYRFWATVTTMITVFIFTGKWETTVFVAGIDLFVKIFLHYGHERMWNFIKFGRKNIDPMVIWLTGLSASGKSHVSEEVTRRLQKRGLRVERLDGRNVRSLFPEMGFGREERNAHVKRIGYLSSLLEKNGVFVVAAFESPFRDSREFSRSLCKNFVEVYLSTPLEVCQARDKDHFYERAKRGELKNVAGVDQPYEAPQNPDLNLDISQITIDQAADQIVELVNRKIRTSTGIVLPVPKSKGSGTEELKSHG